MPIYEYQCQVCGHHFEHIQKVTDKLLRKCPECGQQRLQKLVSSTSFQLKGEGWYVTDFRDKKKPAPANSSEASASSGEKQSETSTSASSESGKPAENKTKASGQEQVKKTTTNK